MDRVYVVFIHKNKSFHYGGHFYTREKAKAVCDAWNKAAWNKANKNKTQFAYFVKCWLCIMK